MNLTAGEALGRVTLFRDLLREFIHDSPPTSSITGITHLWNIRRDEDKGQIAELQPDIEKIATAIDRDTYPDPWNKSPQDESWGQELHVAASRLIGILKRTPPYEPIGGARPPTLNVEALHEWVSQPALTRWQNGQYVDAVHRAAEAVEKRTREKIGKIGKIGKVGLIGVDVYSQAFGIDNEHSRLRFAHLEEGTPDWTSAHKGAQLFGMGCVQGIRNLAAHTDKDLPEQEALEYLAALSVLARWVATATPTTTSKPDAAVAPDIAPQ